MVRLGLFLLLGVYGVLYCFFLVKNGGQEVNDWVIQHKGSV